ncbi:uncharacterized protein V6R79_001877 [Siganus canaliculatus]
MVVHELEEVKVEEEEDKKQKVCRTQRHFYGLYNQGSTCYLNSVLQVLFMTPELHDKFETSETITKQQKLDPQLQTIDEELWNLFKLLEKTTCNTESLTKILHITNVHEQCDAAECLEKILNQISSQASEIFQGVLRNTTKCFEDHSIIEDSDPFWTLPVSLKDSSDSVVSVKGAFEKIFQPTAFCEDNMVHCSECRTKTEAISVCEMEKSPQILILLLKRFDFDYYFMSYVKSDCRVDVPRTLQTEEKEYELYGIVHHMGSLRFGHYMATILSSEDNTWHEFNDSQVNKADEQLFEQTDTYTSRTAYLLIYRASGCPRVEVKHDQRDEGGPDLEKEVDGGEERKEEREEEPAVIEKENSEPNQQQNSTDLLLETKSSDEQEEDLQVENISSDFDFDAQEILQINEINPRDEERHDHPVEEESSLDTEGDAENVGLIQEFHLSPQQNPSDVFEEWKSPGKTFTQDFSPNFWRRCKWSSKTRKNQWIIVLVLFIVVVFVFRLIQMTYALPLKRDPL